MSKGLSLWRRIWLCMVASVLVGPSTAQEGLVLPKRSAKERGVGYAIVIGVDSYLKLDPLKYAVKDAEDLVAYLRSQGWAVSLMRSSDANAALRPDSKASILNEVRFVSRQAKVTDRVLLYFAGHGFLLGEENYLCPSGVRSATDVENAISHTEILDAFSVGRAVKKAIIIDACRQSPGGRNVIRGFTRKELEESRGIWHLYSAAPGFKSYEPERGTVLGGEAVENGLFTHFLLKGLEGPAELNRDGFLTLVEVAMYVEGEMAKASVARSIQRQIPYLLWDGEVKGDFELGRAQRRTVRPKIVKEVPPKRHPLVGSWGGTLTQTRGETATFGATLEVNKVERDQSFVGVYKATLKGKHYATYRIEGRVEDERVTFQTIRFLGDHNKHAALGAQVLLQLGKRDLMGTWSAGEYGGTLRLSRRE